MSKNILYWYQKGSSQNTDIKNLHKASKKSTQEKLVTLRLHNVHSQKKISKLLSNTDFPLKETHSKDVFSDACRLLDCMIMNSKLTREQISSHQPQMRGNTPISTTTSKETLSKNKGHQYHPNGDKSFPVLTCSRNYLNNNVADSKQATRPMKSNKSCQALQHLVKERLSISRNNKTRSNLGNTYYYLADKINVVPISPALILTTKTYDFH